MASRSPLAFRPASAVIFLGQSMAQRRNILKLTRGKLMQFTLRRLNPQTGRHRLAPSVTA